MSSVNRVTIIGHLGADPEVRYTNGGGAVCNLRIATSENWTDKEGNKQERTEWHSVSVWGKTAEHCGQYLAKGRQVYVEGRLQTREYTDKEGIERKVWEIQADRVTFLGSGDGAGAGGGRAEGGGHRGSGSSSAGTSGQGGGNRQGGGNAGNRGGSGGNSGGGWGGGGGSGQSSSGKGGASGGGGGGFDDPIPFAPLPDIG